MNERPTMRIARQTSIALILGLAAACDRPGADEDAGDEASADATTSDSGTATGGVSASGSTTDAPSSAGPSTSSSGGDDGSTSEDEDSGSGPDSDGPAMLPGCIADLEGADFGLGAATWTELGNDRQNPDLEPSATPGGARATLGHVHATACGFLMLAENDGQWAVYGAPYGGNFQRLSSNAVEGGDIRALQVTDGTLSFLLTNRGNQTYLYRMPTQGGELAQVYGPDGYAQQIFDVHLRGSDAYVMGWNGFNNLYRIPSSGLMATTLELGEPIGFLGRSRAQFAPWTDDVVIITGSPSSRLDLTCVENGDSLDTCVSTAMAGALQTVDARVGDWVLWFDANADVLIAYNPVTDTTLDTTLGIDYRATLAAHVHGDQAALVLDASESTALYTIGDLSGGTLVAELVDTTGVGLRMTDVWFNDAAMLVVSESSNSSGQIRLFGRALP